MSDVITLDPALKKLLNDLPEGAPEDDPIAWVYSPWCEGRHPVPVGVPFDVQLGPWHGPAMLALDIPVFVEYLEHSVPLRVTTADRLIVEPKDTVTIHGQVDA